MAMELILLEHIDNLGQMGEIVKVRPGYARNYLLPQNKALRATKDNAAYFETRKAGLEKANAERRKEAEKQAKKLSTLKVTMIRHASEGGQLYGSVTSKDIASAISDQSGEKIERNMVQLDRGYKLIGLFPVTIVLHPEVRLAVTINIARSEEEAKIQAKRGKALLAENEQTAEEEKAGEKAEEAKEEMLEEGALEAEKEKAGEDAKKTAEKEAKDKEKAEKKAAKKAEIEAEEKEAAETEVETEALANVDAESPEETPAEESAEKTG